MTETTEWFNFGKDSKAVRVLDKDNQKWMPLSDIAYCIGYDRSGLNKLVDQNSELFVGMKGMVVTTTPGGSQELVCLNRDGVVGILMKLSYARIKDPVRKQKVVQFQKWAVGVLNSAIKNGGVPKEVVATTTTSDPVKIANDCKRLAKAINGDSQRLIVAAFFKHGFDHFAPHIPTHDVIMGKVPLVPARVVTKDQTKLSGTERPLIESVTTRDLGPAPSPKPEGMLSATDIAQKTLMSPIQINKFLYNNQFLIMDGVNRGEWRITEKGKEYGCEVPYKPRPEGPEVYRVYWYPKILEKFNVKVSNA